MKTFTNLSTLAAVAAVASLAFSSPVAQAQAAATKPAQQCLTDLTAFDSQLQKDGYWLHGSGYGYGYPMYGYGYAYGGERLPAASSVQANGYWRARPGYEVRTLLASANILAQRGDQQACESVLGSARVIYTTYSADLRSGKVPRFKAAPGNKLFVLASTKAGMDAAPQVKEDQNLQQADFAAESQKVNAYWVAHLAR